MPGNSPATAIFPAPQKRRRRSADSNRGFGHDPNGATHAASPGIPGSKAPPPAGLSVYVVGFGLLAFRIISSHSPSVSFRNTVSASAGNMYQPSRMNSLCSWFGAQPEKPA